MSHRLRVLQVLRPAAGGMARHVATLCASLPPDETELGVAAPESHFPADLPRGIPRYPAPISARASLLRDLRAAAQVARAARGYDLLHGHGLRGAWIAGWAARARRMPCVATAHNIPSASRAVRIALSGAGIIIAVSDAVRRALVGSGVQDARVRIVRNGVAVGDVVGAREQTRSRLGIAADTPMILAAGRLSREKGMDVLLRAAPAITPRHQRSVVVIAGDGPERAALTALSERVGDKADVRLLGWVDDPWSLMAACDVVVAPSLSEGQGLTVIEAMALGRPVVASGVGGIPEVVDDGRTGLLVPPGDASALARALVTLLEDTRLREAMGEAAHNRARDEFSVDAMVAGTMGVYAEAQRSRQAGRRPAG